MSAPPRPRRPRRGSLLALGLGVLAAAGVLVWLLTPSRPAEIAVGGPFKLQTGTGARVTARDYRGKYLLVYFGYTNCPDLCPTTLYNIAQALRLMGAQAKAVQPLFITVDPARDTAPVIGRYVALFSPRIVGLTGSAAAIHDVVQEYHVYVGPEDPKTGAIDHGAILYVMGPDGRFITGLRDDLPPPALATDLAELMKENPS
jgi:protein SCO1